MTDQGIIERDNAQVVRSYFEQVWNRGDLLAVERFFADEFTNFGHTGPDARALIAKIVETWRTAFPDLRFEVDDEVVQRDAVVHLITCTGTHEGRFEHPAVGVLPPTGRSFKVDHMHIHRVRAGQIVHHWGTRNDLAMLQQLGVEIITRTPATLTSSAGWMPTSGR